MKELPAGQSKAVIQIFINFHANVDYSVGSFQSEKKKQIKISRAMSVFLDKQESKIMNV